MALLLWLALLTSPDYHLFFVRLQHPPLLATAVLFSTVSLSYTHFLSLSGTVPSHCPALESAAALMGLCMVVAFTEYAGKAERSPLSI